MRSRVTRSNWVSGALILAADRQSYRNGHGAECCEPQLGFVAALAQSPSAVRVRAAGEGHAGCSFEAFDQKATADGHEMGGIAPTREVLVLHY